MRTVREIHSGSSPHWVGDGFHVRTLFSYDDETARFSPFLLLDYGAPRDFTPTEARRGVGAHPHRGFETVTLAFEGEVEHRDSAGHAGRIGPGDVQWMTAAAGVLNEEFHGRDFARRGGRLEMVQLWVNLPRAQKLAPPRYQDLVDTAFPRVALEGGGGIVRVIAGDFRGARGPAATTTPIELLDVRLEAGAATTLELPADHNALVLVRRRPVRIGDTTAVEAGQLAELTHGDGGISVHCDAPAELVVMAGAPIDEPVVGYGPFVMNTRDEIVTAIRDFQDGRFGELA